LASEREIHRPSEITPQHLDLYRSYLHHYAKANGKPQSVLSQQVKLTAVRVFFRWLSKQNFILFNPASEIDLPRTPDRLPKAVLSAPEAEQVLNQVDIKTPLGLRDRAILETLYSTGIRRAELIGINLSDLDVEKGTLTIRRGKGSKDRVVPIGERALVWIEKYAAELRPDLIETENDGTLFLMRDGRPLTPDALGQRVAAFVKKANLGKTGSCHLFRHTAATLMLEGGADIRYIQAMLGHAELSTTQIYTRVSIQKLKAIHDATHPSAHLRRTADAGEQQG
jgi:integrase/recombinase XerD